MARVKSGTLVATTVATVTLDAAYSSVQVTNVSGTAPIYFTVNGTTPTVAGDDCEVVAGAGEDNEVPCGGVNAVVVKLISSGTPTYTVSGRG